MEFSIFFSLKEVGAFVFVGGEIRSLLPLGRLVLCLGAGTLSISLVSGRSQVTLTGHSVCIVGGEKDEPDIQSGVCAVCW